MEELFTTFMMEMTTCLLFKTTFFSCPQLAPITASAVTSLAVELRCSLLGRYWAAEDRDVVDRQ